MRSRESGSEAMQAPRPTGQRPSEIALQRVVACHLQRHAKPGVRWALGQSEVTITTGDRELVLDLNEGLDRALRQLGAWGVLRC
jgi:hypothetical protein